MSDGEGACHRKSKLGTEEHVFNPTLSRQRQGLCESEVSLAYILSVKLARNTKLSHCVQKIKQNKIIYIHIHIYVYIYNAMYWYIAVKTSVCGPNNLKIVNIKSCKYS